MTSPSSTVYHGVISLNNKAVSLIERQAFSRASEILVDAIHILMYLTESPGTTSQDKNKNNNNRAHQSLDESKADMQAKLWQANQWLADPQLSGRAVQHHDSSQTVCLDSLFSTPSDETSLSLPVIAGQHDCHGQQSLSCSALEFPLRAEAPIDHSVCPDNTLLAILAGNYAVSLFLRSGMETEKIKTTQLQITAFHLLKGMLDHLAPHQRPVYSEVLMENVELHQSLVLSTAVVQSILKITDEMGNHSALEAFHHRLIQLRGMIREMDQSILLNRGYSSEKAAAPAA